MLFSVGAPNVNGTERFKYLTKSRFEEQIVRVMQIVSVLYEKMKTLVSVSYNTSQTNPYESHMLLIIMKTVYM